LATPDPTPDHIVCAYDFDDDVSAYDVFDDHASPYDTRSTSSWLPPPMSMYSSDDALLLLLLDVMWDPSLQGTRSFNVVLSL
jgi:hypothetical protein